MAPPTLLQKSVRLSEFRRNIDSVVGIVTKKSVLPDSW